MVTEQYPEAGTSGLTGENFKDLLKIYSVTYNVPFYFLPYDFKLNETLTPNWNPQTVIGRMDPIMNFKNMQRTITLSFKARQKNAEGSAPLYFSQDELLHSIDHLKKCLYPRYNASQVMISPPLFRFQYKNLINAGEEQFEITRENGVLGVVTAFTANFATEPNKIYFPTGEEYAYPKVFDINITFTVMNENLVSTQQSSILNKQYFYKYVHEHGHENGDTVASVAGAAAAPGATTDATVAAVTAGK